MRKFLFFIALIISGLGLNAQDCPIPTGLDVKAEIDVPDYGKKYKVTVTWNAVPEAELYAVYATSQYVPEPMWVGNVSAGTTEWVMGSDLGGELYFYVRTICDSENNITSDISEGVGVILDENLIANELEAPENLVATVKNTSSIELTWDAVEDENARSYFVYRDGEEIANITETTYTDENLKTNTEYCYVVTTMGVDKESEPSEEVCATTKGEGIEELASAFNIYPNPVEDELILATEMNVESISVYDIYGRQQAVSYQLSAISSIDVAELNAGIYFVKIVTDKGEIVKRFAKE